MPSQVGLRECLAALLPALARSCQGCPRPWVALGTGSKLHRPPPRPLRLNPNLARSPNFTCTLSLCHWLMAHRGQQIRDPVQPAPAPGGRVADVKCMTFILTVSL